MPERAPPQESMQRPYQSEEDGDPGTLDLSCACGKTSTFSLEHVASTALQLCDHCGARLFFGEQFEVKREQVQAALDDTQQLLRVERDKMLDKLHARDPFGDTEDLGAMVAARDKLQAAQDRVAKHAMPAVIKDLGLQVVGALYVLAVALLASALIVANCGGG